MSYLPEGYADALTVMMRFINDQGYFGPKSKEEVEWTGQNVRGKLITFEDFADKHADKFHSQSS